MKKSDLLKKHNIKEEYEQIASVVKGYKRVAERVELLECLGFQVKEFPMGSGGVLQVKEMASTIRIQIGYGIGKHNYAQAVEIRKNA